MADGNIPSAIIWLQIKCKSDQYDCGSVNQNNIRRRMHQQKHNSYSQIDWQLKYYIQTSLCQILFHKNEICYIFNTEVKQSSKFADSKFYGTNIGPTWGFSQLIPIK